MRQDFSRVTEKELSEMFPVLLEPHAPFWREAYLAEERYLRKVFGEKIVRISHIGSSAVPGLISKPTIDILLEISQDTDIPAITELMRDAGYIVNTPPKDVIMYLKGYTPRGFEGQVYHIHVRYPGDWDELYFRDYLIAHPDAAEEYGKLKIKLKEKYANDRDGYTEAKGEFVRKYTGFARAEFPGRFIPNK
jgi:GrpB-like predicted nucleotidyltransferase (UPF0157 family)